MRARPLRPLRRRSRSEDPDLEPGEDLAAEDLASDEDPMIDEDVPAGEAEGVVEGDEA